MILVKQHCEAVENGNIQVLPKKTAQNYHEQVKEWTLHQKSLKREFRFKDFKESMAFIQKVADIAEQEGHHPDIQVFYNRVVLQLSTHVLAGITVNDFIVAAKIDALLQ